MFKPHPDRRPRALTLMELIVGIGLFALIVALGLNGLRLTHTTGQSRGLASQIKGLMTSARSQAAVSGEPVALIFPTAGGATPIVTECALLSGRQRGRLQRRLSFSGNFPDSGIFLGEWALSGGQAFTPVAPPPGAEGPRFTLGDWMPIELATHAAFVFLPNGEILSNQRAVRGEYALVVGNRFDIIPGSGTATLTAASDASTVMLSQHGTCRVQRGVWGGLVAEGGQPRDSWTLTTLAPPTAPSTAPQITAVEVAPAPIDPNFAAALGAHCIIEQGGVVTLRTQATDTDGGPLFCQWTSSDGALSHAQEVPMFYSPEAAAWVSEWHWKPPATAAVNDIFELEVTVRDESQTASLVSGVVSRPNILVVDRGLLVFASARNFSAVAPDQRSHVFTVRYDGTDLRAIAQSMSTAGFEGGLAPSRDGRRIAIGSDYGDTALKLISSDGAESQTVALPAAAHKPCFSPDGNSVYVSTGPMVNPFSWQHHQVSFDAAGNPVISASPFHGMVAGWSPDGTQALVQLPNGDVELRATDNTLVATLHDATTDPGGPGVALDWNNRGIFYAINQTELGLFPSEPGQQEILRHEPGPATTTSLGQFVSVSDVGGDGRYVFYMGDGIMQRDLLTNVDRMVLPGFLEPAPVGFSYGGGRHMWKATKSLMSSI